MSGIIAWRVFIKLDVSHEAFSNRLPRPVVRHVVRHYGCRGAFRRRGIQSPLRGLPRSKLAAHSAARGLAETFFGTHSAHSRLRLDDEHRLSDEARGTGGRRQFSGGARRAARDAKE